MIQIKNLYKAYGTGENHMMAVNNISLDVSKGEFVVIMGRSGCGKSTLLNILGCIDTFDRGSYRFQNKNIASLNQNNLAKLRQNKIGYIYQSYNLIDELNCIDNVALVQGYAGVLKSKRYKRATDLLKKLGLADKAKSFPTQLSGGQQQRIAIARAISNNPNLILADEPTGNLDYTTGLHVMEIIRSLNKEGITIIMVTHDHDLTSYASRIIHMQDGRFVGGPENDMQE